MTDRQTIIDLVSYLKEGRPKGSNKILKARCKKCEDIMESTRGGHFVPCKCGDSFIDRDRWLPDKRHRYGGDAEHISFE